jgi:hypothetical protein
MTWKDRTLNPLKSLVCILGLAVTFALAMAGMVGVLWGLTEAIRWVF